MAAAHLIIATDRRLTGGPADGRTGGRASLVGLAGLPSLRLTTSGLPRSTNLLYFPQGRDFVLTGSNWAAGGIRRGSATSAPRRTRRSPCAAGRWR
ncbi:hypothetical protein [Amycolatopsis sulphurea]|uniref:hypothetical protein n=1 Tax=Amycolatopsis sulphurea TaxID=76022 RepID=UPI003CCBFA90